MRLVAALVTGVLAFGACAQAGPTPPPATPAASPVRLPEVVNGPPLHPESSLVDMGTVPVGVVSNVVVTFAHEGSEPLTAFVVSVDAPAAVGASMSGLDGGCHETTLDVSTPCRVTLSVQPTEPVVDGVLLVTARGLQASGQPVRGHLVIGLRATSWESRPAVGHGDTAFMSNDESTAGATEHSLWTEEESLDGWDATAYARRLPGVGAWTDAKTLPGIFASGTAAGSHVFVALEAYGCGGAGVGVVRSLRDGVKGSWSSVHCLSRSTDMMSLWAPAIAAVGHRVYVAAISAGTSRVVLYESGDDGASWRRSVIGRARGDEAGEPPVTINVVRGNLVASWSDAGTVIVRVLRHGARTWSAPERLAAGTPAGAAVRDGRLLLRTSSTDETGEVWRPGLYLWTPDGGWLEIALPTAAVSIDANAVETLGPEGSIAVSYVTSVGSGDVAGYASWALSTDNGRTWTTEPVPGMRGTSVTYWTADGRPSLELWSDDEETTMLATRMTPAP